jgi:signal peptidase I
VQSFGSQPSRGDILVFRSTQAALEMCGASGIFVQRLIGLPGETITQRSGGLVLVDGKPQDDPYARRSNDSTTGTWHVPAARYFLMGDNRGESCDSRRWGGVPRSNILGRVVKIRRVE